ncbi:MAG: phenylacetaldoxime dehydratase family protein [Candidatus Sulfotelmatobacter sp.]
MKVNRLTVDLSTYPDLVVIYLGMPVRTLTGLKTLLGFGPKIAKSVADHPDGLLLHEFFLWSLFPPHAGIRQYWRDFESLERWARSEPHRAWWKTFLRDSGGTGFWHETYFMRGGIEAVYDDLARPTGLLSFAPTVAALGPMFSSRQRAHLAGTASIAGPVAESELPDH